MLRKLLFFAIFILSVSAQSQNIGGNVFAGPGIDKLDIGIAYLYHAGDTIPVDTAVFDTLGYYDFYQVPSDTYTVRVEPSVSSQYYGQYQPTYYGDVLNSGDATEIILTANKWDADIHLINSSAIPENNISKVFSAGSIYPNPVTGEGRIAISLPCAAVIEMIIYDQLGQIVYKKNIKGNTGNNTLFFQANNLQNGIYYLRISSDNSFKTTRKFLKH